MMMAVLESGDCKQVGDGLHLEDESVIQFKSHIIAWLLNTDAVAYFRLTAITWMCGFSDTDIPTWTRYCPLFECSLLICIVYKF